MTKLQDKLAEIDAFMADPDRRDIVYWDNRQGFMEWELSDKMYQLARLGLVFLFHVDYQLTKSGDRTWKYRAVKRGYPAKAGVPNFKEIYK